MCHYIGTGSSRRTRGNNLMALLDPLLATQGFVTVPQTGPGQPLGQRREHKLPEALHEMVKYV